MNNWQKFVSNHHNIEVIDDNTIIVKNVIHDTINNILLDDKLTRCENGYIDSTNILHENIRAYLGY
jgi:hypothetical protein